MDLTQPLGRRQSDASFLSRTFGNRTRWHNSSLESVQEVFGPPGLNTIHEPLLEARVEIIFVHGLRGGSRQAWSYSSDPAYFWPREWLPHHPDFQHARIHTYGYNSDWMLREKNSQSIHDFGRNFIEAMHSSPDLRRDPSTRIILVAHSMGGLVTKKAVILATHEPSFKDIRDRIDSIFFFGTPHRGADLATMLSKYLKATGTSSKYYVTDLMRGSEMTNVLTDQFRHVYQGIELYSFYETLPMTWTVGSGVIVERDSAIMGLPHEHTISIDADHRYMNKYQSPQDPEYRKVIDCLRSAVQDAMSKVPPIKNRKHLDDLHTLETYLNIAYLPDDELYNIEDERSEHSCEWFVQNPHFQKWISDPTSERYLWLKGPPGSGKTFITASAIGQINPRQCSFYFFKGQQHEAKLNSLLQSIAYQMALNDHGVRETLLSIQRDSLQLPKDDHRTTWRKLFLNGIFQNWPSTTQYWVIDALDECQDTGKKLQQNLQSLFSSIDKSLPLKIFVSSRPVSEVEQLITHLPHQIIEVTQDATSGDIRRYVEAYSDTLLDETEEEKKELVERIIQKSSGFFLWVRVILKLLEDCWSAEQIREVIEEVPEELEDLYYKNLEAISAKTQGSKSRHGASITRLAKTIMKWTVCAMRPLTLEELKHAIKLDINDEIKRDLKNSLGSLCGHLVYVDQKNLVQMTHQTAKDFLTRPDLDSEFRIDIAQGHLEIATACMKYLCSDEMKHSKRNRVSSYGHQPQNGPLCAYACQFFADHLFRATSQDNQLFSLLMTFLRTNVLTWIERQASRKNLDQLIRASAHFKAYMNRRTRHVAALQDDVSQWAKDLPRIVTEFGGNLLDCPHAIHDLIPPLCPTSSLIHTRFAAESGLQLQGLTNEDWYDRISSTIFKISPANCLVCHDQWYAIGVTDGNIYIYDTSTCSSLMTFSHGDSVRMLTVGSNNKILASAGLYTVKVWNLESRAELFRIKLDDPPLTIAFDENTTVLVIVTRASEVFRYSFNDKRLLSRKILKNILEAQGSQEYNRVPINMELSSDTRRVAVAYRSHPLLLYDYETCQPLQKFSADRNVEDTSWHITSVCFNPNIEFHALAVAYWDGTLAVFDTDSLSIIRQVKAASQTLAISPDGRTLAGGNTSGQIQLFDFATLDLLYTIAPSQQGIVAMAFTGDSRRLIDARAHQVNIWEPPVLTRTTINDNQSEPSDSANRAVETTQVSAETDWISSVVECYQGSRVICGKSNGLIQMYDMTTQTKLSWSLYKHKGGPAVVSTLDWNESHQLIASADVSGRFQVVQLDSTAKPRTKPSKLLYQGQLEYGASVECILINPAGTKVLIASSLVEEIWCLRTRKMVQSHRTASRVRCKWFNHPSDASKMIRFQGEAIQVFDWEKFEPQSPLVSVQDKSGPMSTVKVSSSMLVRANGGLMLLFLVRRASESTRRPGGPPRAQLYATNLSHLDRHTTEVVSYPVFGDSAQSSGGPGIDLLIGMVPSVLGGQLVVFMTEFGWLCSFDISDGLFQYSYRRHFLIPFVWRSTQDHLLARATQNREVLFVQGDEIAVARNGFDESDLVPLTPA